MSLSLEQMQQLFWSFRDVRIAMTAVELDVFANIGKGSTCGEIAQRIDADPRATEMLLNALVSLELIIKQGDRYWNCDLSALHLTGDSRMAMMHQVHLWHRWSTLTECVRKGTAVSERRRDEAGTEAFIAAMHRNASERASAVVNAVDASKTRNMLDLGGGSGAYSIAFANANPQLQSTILDGEPVLEIAARHIAQAGLSNRIHTKPGDMLTTELGTGFDLVLLSQILHMFSPDENRLLLQRAFAALGPGGRVVVQEFILDPDKTSPRWAVFFSLNMLVGSPGGSSYSADELRAFMESAGFRQVRHLPLGQTGLMVGEK